MQNTVQEQDKILVIDDEPSIRRALSTLLESFGKIDVAESGQDGIRMLKSQEYDLIFTDYEMPRGNGLEVLHFLETQGAKAPAVLVTAFGTKELIIETLKYHVFGILEKPFSKDGVQDIARKALQKRAEDRNLLRLATIGTKAGELVHEIANPLSVLDLRVSLNQSAGRSLSGDDISRPIEKIKKILATTKASLRGEEEFLGSFNLKDALQIAQKEFEFRSKKFSIPVQVLGHWDIQLKGDADKISQVIVNLVNNSIDAIQNLSEKWIRIELLPVDPAENPQRIRITFTDSGSGIPEEFRTKLFKEIFSTKGNQGNGLGLGIIRNIVSQHGGTITYEESGPNTQFKLVLLKG